MKYYLYVSASKVNRLFSQIPQDIKSRIATEIKINLAVLSVTFKDKDEASSSEDALYTKLGVVTKYIQYKFEVGTVDNPQTYIAGTLNVQWGEYPNTGLVYFTGATDSTILGLGGSLKHVTGNEEVDKLMRATTGPDPLLRALRSELRIPFQEDVEDFLFPDEAKVFRPVRQAFTKIVGINQKVEFLAKTLAHNEDQKTKVVLATPIYVALAD